MQTLLKAGFVTVEESLGAFIVGFADRKFDTSQYFMLQPALDPAHDDGVYLERTSQAYATYGTVSSCLLCSGRIELTVDERTADDLGTEPTFAVEFSCDSASLHRLQAGLERIFSGTPCRLETSTAR